MVIQFRCSSENASGICDYVAKWLYRTKKDFGFDQISQLDRKQF